MVALEYGPERDLATFELTHSNFDNDMPDPQNKDIGKRLGSTVQSVCFRANKIRDAKCVWSDLDSNEDILPKTIRAQSDLEQLACIVKPNVFFERIEALDNEEIALLAERYGGRGIGQNGGGARCGNIGEIQLKGVGVNPVVGSHANLYNSSGIYPMYEAIAEVVNYEVFRRLLPIGLVRYVGVLSIGESPFFVTAESPAETQRGTQALAIGIREKCVRPGHFLRAGAYEPLRYGKYRLPSDVSRVAQANRTLKSLLPNRSDFVRFFGEFLANCANQMAFAYVNRIAHGALSPSNLSIDGRWLDLTNTSFVPSGKQYRAGPSDPSSAEEILQPIEIVHQLTYTFGKYNGFELNTSPLSSYYFEQFEAYCRDYFAEVVGLRRLEIENLSLNKELEFILSQYKKVLDNSTTPLMGVPKKLDNDGPETEFLDDLFLRNRRSTNDSSSSRLNREFERILKEVFVGVSPGLGNIDSLRIATAIRAYRRLLFRPFFFVGRVYLRSRSAVESGSCEIATLIDGSARTAEWVFGLRDETNSVLIFASPRAVVSFDPKSHTFTTNLDSNQMDPTLVSIDELMCIVQHSDSALFSILEFDFRPSLAQLLSRIRSICHT